MPNSYQHSVAGCITGLSVMGILELISQSNAVQTNQCSRIDWSAVIGKATAGAAIGTIAGNIPDILEPATNPYHRQFFHSETSAILAIAGLCKVGLSKMDNRSKQLLACLVAGYLVHLNDDSKTEFGLPAF